VAMLKAMNTKINTMESDMAAMKDHTESSNGGGFGRRHDDARDPDFHPKPKKWDFPRYDGTTDPMLFLNKCDAYFRQHRTTPEEKVRIASYHLDEVAQLWFNQVQEDDGTPNWAHFKELLNVRFGPPLRSAPMFELAECRRTGSVDEYSNRFQALLPPRRPLGGSTACPALHRGAATATQPRSPPTSSDDPRGGHEPGAASGIDGGRTTGAGTREGATTRGSCSTSPASRPAGPSTIAGATRTTGGFATGTRRWSPAAPHARRDGRAPSPKPVLQLQ
jgi:hypothetical protein